MSVLESKRVCPNCGHELHSRPYLMAVDPDAAGLITLWRQWFDGDRTVLSALAVFGSCLIAALLITAVI